jgi:hypothetical protein
MPKVLQTTEGKVGSLSRKKYVLQQLPENKGKISGRERIQLLKSLLHPSICKKFKKENS